MPSLRARLAPLGAVLLLFGCGGESRSAGTDDNGGSVQGGGSATGGSSTGGTSRGGSSAGGAPSGGTSTGGTASGGTGTGGFGAGGDAGTGTSGTGARPPSVCALPAPEPISCDSGSVWFFHDPVTDECVGRGPSDCPMGWPNVFGSLAECLAACPSARPAVAACDFSYECDVASAACCGACDPVAESDLVAINRQRASDHLGGCGIVCGPCPEVDELARTSQYFIAECAGGSCALRDIRHGPETECAEHADCSLRYGAGCCATCGAGLLSVSSLDLTDRCDPASDCAECGNAIPEQYSAVCVAETGRCGIAITVSEPEG